MATPFQLAHILSEVLRKAPEKDQPRIIRGFVAFLRRKRLMAQAPRMFRVLEEMAEQEEGTVLAEVAHLLAVPHARTVVRPEFIGGVRLSAGEKVVDATIRGRLQKLRSVFGD
ncbi:MAG: hypothetical protein A2682_00970 [Candidatus Terrybacteria bacterium RIFCSPHIGHO2_01_FULL_58_15]|uniref:Uncharacterized protein n=1 Tax=Terrybacteria sp. (strain RIFCSPHIGHO2_01_FULL_58_15) TaxID=1802363 RepID=A0A1G2PLR9_TERXR|nr:MAG: hypothetical protein A2682_00970 [Candidatus Terrybacteria bacterium RIFCSPHIGHO2_01_FULL_58_15]